MHYYYNDQWQLLTETIEVDDVETVYAIYHWHPFYIDALATRMRASDTHFFLHDANFNVTAAVSDSTDTVVERYQYTPYGEVEALDDNFAPDSNGESDIANQHLYTGRERDPETGLQLNRERYYASHLGRWLSRDTFAPRSKYEQQSLGGFAFADSMSVLQKELATLPTPGDTPSGDMQQWLLKMIILRQYIATRQLPDLPQPLRASDGYQDGMSLYCAYFVPCCSDPFGTKITCWSVGGFAGAWVAGSASYGRCWDDCGNPPQWSFCAGLGVGGGGGIGVGRTTQPGCMEPCIVQGINNKNLRGHGQVNIPWGGIDGVIDEGAVGGGFEGGTGAGGAFTIEGCNNDEDPIGR